MAKETEKRVVLIEDYDSFKKEYRYEDPPHSFYYKYFKRPISYPLVWLIYQSQRGYKPPFEETPVCPAGILLVQRFP